MEFFHMPKVLNGLKWPGIITLVPNREEFPRMCEQEDQTIKESREGWDPDEHKCDLAWGTKSEPLAPN